ncbi:hypothetical protein B5R10_002951 [Salmonella enterica subsp. enterica serovar Adelaide]|uniref:Malate transporter n=1 Tax=Salmonella enterica subsp. enterica serovar Chester TaxID=149386 RepID=A0A5U8MCY3_SALET|nr:hypothetical protein [Salmonella enterica]EBO4428105.1 hypothetical protein [Salmonella enterica subsp. enterica]EBU8229815.1 hypothetical protein [Salmonella enterica subsp. enterica serovar Nima]EBY6995351.1 hypothetical protein [Salmonella enterica subsp. enterica serovar Pomona]ECV3497094.1 hypothetical protein [Salmonella enterica subsp. enterica serovar Derby]EDX6481761.1 hypothetical protein [Salmonella enterica subsp. enterica serovar Landwasser]EEH0470767.1 hypothetical protein [S
MKDYKPRYEELNKYYQTWLAGYTRLAVCQGMCHQNIYHHHTLTVGSFNFPGENEVIAIVPRCLHRIIYGRAADPLTVNDDLSVSLFTQEHLLAHHPMLEGILLSECVRLKQRPLANRLISLFRQFSDDELRLKLVWLCWYDLMLGNCLDDWIDTLRFKNSQEMDIWINNRQEENPALTSMMDEYVCFAWRTTTEPLKHA